MFGKLNCDRYKSTSFEQYLFSVRTQATDFFFNFNSNYKQNQGANSKNQKLQQQNLSLKESGAFANNKTVLFTSFVPLKCCEIVSLLQLDHVASCS